SSACRHITENRTLILLPASAGARSAAAGRPAALPHLLLHFLHVIHGGLMFGFINAAIAVGVHAAEPSLHLLGEFVGSDLPVAVFIHGGECRQRPAPTAASASAARAAPAARSRAFRPLAAWAACHRSTRRVRAALG